MATLPNRPPEGTTSDDIAGVDEDGFANHERNGGENSLENQKKVGRTNALLVMVGRAVSGNHLLHAVKEPKNKLRRRILLVLAVVLAWMQYNTYSKYYARASSLQRQVECWRNNVKTQARNEACKKAGCFHGNCGLSGNEGQLSLLLWQLRRNWSNFPCETKSDLLEHCVRTGGCDRNSCPRSDPSWSIEINVKNNSCLEVCREAHWCEYNEFCNFYMGRPYRQSLSDSPIEAQLLTTTNVSSDGEQSEAGWSVASAAPNALNTSMQSFPEKQECKATFDTQHQQQQQQQQQHVLDENSQPKNQTDGLKSDIWAQRALSEHASIASFAAFTVALLTHAAPPHLVEQALVAAQDEVRHARLSFGQATKNGGPAAFGPGSLPETTLHFTHNLTKLALSVAQEGCIEESLSALGMAHEASAMMAKSTEEAELLVTIATDEARHSGLAWRTLLWICRKDKEACGAVTTDIFSELVSNEPVDGHNEGRGDYPLSSSNHVIQATFQSVFDRLFAWLHSKDPHDYCQNHILPLLLTKDSNATLDPLQLVSSELQQDICRHSLDGGSFSRKFS